MFHYQKERTRKKWLAMFAIPICFFASMSNPLHADTQGIQVVEASYGLNCGADKGNATADIAYSCNGQSSCSYKVNHRRIGDPAVGCGKNYIVTWLCPGASQKFQAFLQPEASGGTVALTCGQSSSFTIQVRSATYGANCGAPEGNATQALETQCNGKYSCAYKIDHQVIGDPAIGCGKVYEYEYMCGTSLRHGFVQAEASRQTAKLSCQ